MTVLTRAARYSIARAVNTRRVTGVSLKGVVAACTLYLRYRELFTSGGGE